MNRRPGIHSTVLLTRSGGRAEVNPYRDGHKEFGAEIVPAEDAPSFRGRWSANFGREAPLHVELGTGTGTWLAASAAAHPDRNWIGVEIRFKRCVQTATRLRQNGSTNGRVVRYSWFVLDELFEPGELDGLYLHHPDPWPDRKDVKNRLIEPGFCAAITRWLKPGAEFRLKTDFAPHAQALLKGIAGLPLEVLGATDDLARDGAPWPDDVVTAYQAAFQGKGVPVHAVRLRRSAG